MCSLQARQFVGDACQRLEPGYAKHQQRLDKYATAHSKAAYLRQFGGIGINIPHKGKVFINFVSNDYRNITNTKQGSYLKPQDNASNKFKNATKID